MKGLRQLLHSGWLLFAIVLLVSGVGYYAWQRLQPGDLPDGFASGNGRIEAVEIDISTRTAGRIKEILANESDFVTARQALARMDTDQLQAQKREALAQVQRATIGIETAGSLVNQREAERRATSAVVAQRQAESEAAEQRLESVKHSLDKDGASSAQDR